MARFLNLLPWRRRRMEQDLERELRYHENRRIEDLTQSGLSATEARRLAALEFGGTVLVQEEVRETWRWRWLDDYSREIRYAGRTLLRSPGFTTAAVLSLSLGIGATTGIFSLVDQVLLRRLPVAEPERLVHLAWRGNALATGWGFGFQMSYPFCQDLQEQKQFFGGVFCRHPTTVNFSTGQQHEPIPAEIVTGSYFAVLGIRPQLGRLIDPSDDRQPGAHPVVVLAHGFWQNQFAGATDVVGRKVLVDNYPLTVIGVAPASFTGIDPLAAPALWIPAAMTEQAAPLDPGWNRLLDRRTAWLHAFGRLHSGTTVEHAKAGLQPWFKSILEADTRRAGFPRVTAEQLRTFQASTLDLLPGAQGWSMSRGSLEGPLWVLMAGTFVLLLLACLNVASLVLARGAARIRELKTRLALGASRSHITRQVLVESLLITLGGGVIGLAAAPVVSQALISFLAQSADLSFRFDRRIFFFAFLASVAAAGLSALAPTLQASRIPLIASLNERSVIGSRAGLRLRKLLVIGQMAFALILLTGAGLFLQTLTHLQAKGPGFADNGLLMFRVDPTSTGYSAPDAEQLMRNLNSALAGLPGAERVAVANTHLLGTGWSTSSVTIERDGQRLVNDRVVSRMRVGPGFFATLGTPVIAGRDFDERDVRPPGSTPTAFRSVIVNQSFARRYFKGRSPVGARLGLGNRPDTPTTIEIIGVVSDFSRRNLRDGEVEQVFLQFWDQDSGDGTFYLRMRGNIDSAFASVRAIVRDVDPALPILDLTTLENQIARTLRTERMLATLSTGFGVVALLLSVVGLFGLMSYIVTHRTQEIGVRLALGATRAAAVWLVVRDAVMMIGIGTGIALPCIWMLGQLVEAQLFGVRAVDGPTIALASALLGLVAISAAALPAWRAASISPIAALRFE